MSDKFFRISIEKLFNWILVEENDSKILGIYKDLFFVPRQDDPFRMQRYGRLLETPIGVAAGPQTQMAQNIIGSWLCGARYIELKTVQTLDEIHVNKPCIEMEDEGYNCEWSQELLVKDSFDEYLNAWVIIHVLKHKFGWNTDEPGFIFNMSVGYDFAGIQNPNVQWFFDKMANCETELNEKINALEAYYPRIREINIPAQLTDNITLSTMHGCPPNEIHKIGKYLIEERKLNTTIKLNPTLLGPEKLRNILNDQLLFDVNVPDEAFEHDLKYPDAIELINSLTESAKQVGVAFSLKLTNTLESLNQTRQLPGSEKMVYTSGRALHPISITLAAMLQSEFNGELDISFCAGVDAFNVADTLACDLKPITVCSDLLKPGGYLRLIQYLENLKKSFEVVKASSIEEFITNTAAGFGFAQSPVSVKKQGLANLVRYAGVVTDNLLYKKKSFPYKNIKTKRELTEYDCVHAPCMEACAVTQNVPDYMYYTSKGDFDSAYRVITDDNPVPNITGNVCDHLCQTKCTRMNYDNTLQIRGIKRFVSEIVKGKGKQVPKKSNGLKASVIGAGPSGLSCAYFLAMDGFAVDVYESKPFIGGMTSDSIPHFRLSEESIDSDFELVKSVGVNFHFDQKVTPELFASLQKDRDYIYIAIGAQKSKKLEIPGEEIQGVITQLDFLSLVRRKEPVKLGERVAVIGGGNSAIDTARTANRLIGDSGKVQVLYRRTINEMPADAEEIHFLLKEGIEIIQLVAPVSITTNNGKLDLECIKMELGAVDAGGRRRPVPVAGSEYILTFDNILTAIGQDVELDFIDGNSLKINSKTKETQITNVYAGGDAVRGADSLINAVGDGQRAAREIIDRVQSFGARKGEKTNSKVSPDELQKKLATRIFGANIAESELYTNKNFELVHTAMSTEEAMNEAERCLYCEDVCNICTTVCPNFANISFTVQPINIPVYTVENNSGGMTINITSTLNIRQEPQIINVRDFCNECGNCDSFCPTSGAPYKTKPKFHLTDESFANEDIGYQLRGETLCFKIDGKMELLTMSCDSFLYDSEAVSAVFSGDEFFLKEVKFKTVEIKEYEFKRAAEMLLLLKNLVKFPLFVS